MYVPAVQKVQSPSVYAYIEYLKRQTCDVSDPASQTSYYVKWWDRPVAQRQKMLRCLLAAAGARGRNTVISGTLAIHY